MIPQRLYHISSQVPDDAKFLIPHKKGQGSTKNGRDSEGRRLGAKAADGELVSGGSIIYRQRGTRIYPGKNVGIGSDDTVYAKVAGSDRVDNERGKAESERENQHQIRRCEEVHSCQCSL